MDVSIIFVNYKTNQLLYQAIESLKNKTKDISYEIIVVDNSMDIEIFNNLKMNSIKYNYIPIKSNSNVGIGNGCNLGEKIAKGDYLLFLNSDIIFINNAVKILYDFIKKDESIGIVGGNLYNSDLTPNLTFINEDFNKWILKKHFYYIPWLFSKLKKKAPTFNYSDQPIKIRRMIIGAVLMIRHSDFNFLGGFDKDIFMYGEESLLCYKVINELKKSIYNVPEAKVIHLDGGSYRKSSIEREKARVDGDFVYFTKSLGKSVAINILNNRIKILNLKLFINHLKIKKNTELIKLYKIRKKIYKEKIENER